MNEVLQIPVPEKLGSIDYKVVKRHLPRTKNDQVLAVVFEKDPNIFLRKTKSLFGAGFLAKLFGIVTLKLDVQFQTILSKSKVSYTSVNNYSFSI